MIGGDGIGIKNLELALSRRTEVAVDTGMATGGGNTTLDDTTKSWTANQWVTGLSIIQIVKPDGSEYFRIISANTATQITFAALPGGVVAAAGDLYSVRIIGGGLTDVTDRWNRQLGQIDLARVLGAVLAHANPVISRLTDGVGFIDPRDVSDRAARLLGIIYGSQGQQLLQRAATFDLLIQLRHAGVEIDPRAIRALTAADIITVQSLTQWGGVALTGRDISLDLANLDITLSALRDAICAAAPNAKTLNDLYTQLDVTLSTQAKLKRWGRAVDPAWVHAAEQVAPGAGTALVTKVVTAGKTGYIYGFFIMAGEGNDFKINWTSGAAAKSVRLTFSGKNSVQYVDFAALNEGLGADAATNVTITNVNAAGAGVVYQARLFYAEV